MPFDLPNVDVCLFCERIEGRRDDWAVIEQDDTTISFISPRQFEEGQALVIPRRHAPTILDLSELEAQAVIAAVRRLAVAMEQALDPDGITVYQNNGVVSNQEVPHFHMHVVPRRYGSGWGEGPKHIAAIDNAVREEQIRRNAAPIKRQRAVAKRIARALTEKESTR